LAFRLRGSSNVSTFITDPSKPVMGNTREQRAFTARETVRAVAIPLSLIALGGLFLLDYSGGPAVRQTWPVLLIVWGGAWALTHVFAR
jgi:hypothetical protein